MHIDELLHFAFEHSINSRIHPSFNHLCLLAHGELPDMGPDTRHWAIDIVYKLQHKKIKNYESAHKLEVYNRRFRCHPPLR